jgi:hypothetical protein
MRGARILLILTLALVFCGVALASSGPEVAWKSQRLKFRTQTTAGGATGYLDRDLVTMLSGGAIDTSVAFAFRCVPNLAIPDSLNNIIVLPVFTSATDAADTVYVALDGSNDNGRTWQILNTVNTANTVNGFTAGAVAGMAQIRTPVYFNARASSTTNVLGRSPVIIPASVYSAWFGWTLFRVRLLSASFISLPSGINVFVVYPSQEK